MSTKQEYIAEADRFLVQAGVPTYSEVLSALTDASKVLSNVEDDRFNIDMDEISIALSSARAAIAKATGASA